MIRLAILMTCYNRREITIACLESLERQVNSEICIVVYLVDDGCIDGTAEAAAKYENVRILRGDGSLFWTRGMHFAFATAMQDDHDGYLWLNDDVVLDPDALSRLLETWERMHVRAPRENTIVIGSTRDPESGNLTYGGLRRLSRIRRLSFGRVEPHVTEVELDTFEGNFTYIPAGTAQAVGNLDPTFLCAGGDTDYGLRARALGVRIWLMVGTIGCCRSNPSSEFWCAPGIGVRERWRRKNDPVRGLPWVYAKHFAKRHGGPFWLLYLLWAHRRLVWPTGHPAIPTLANTPSSLSSRDGARTPGSATI